MFSIIYFNHFYHTRFAILATIDGVRLKRQLLFAA